MCLEIDGLRKHARLSRRVLVRRNRHSHLEGHLADVSQVRIDTGGVKPILQQGKDNRGSDILTSYTRLDIERDGVERVRQTRVDGSATVQPTSFLAGGGEMNVPRILQYFIFSRSRYQHAHSAKYVPWAQPSPRL